MIKGRWESFGANWPKRDHMHCGGKYDYVAVWPVGSQVSPNKLFYHIHLLLIYQRKSNNSLELRRARWYGAI